MSDDPYSGFRDDEIPTNLMSVLTQLADEQQESEREVERLEQELQEAKDTLKDIQERRIPSAAEGLKGKFTLPDGRELQVDEKIRASIAGEKKAPAISWMDANGYGHLPKRQIIIEFSKAEEEKFQETKKLIESSEVPLNLKIKSDVHHMTLESWVREQLAEGVDLPRDTFGIYVQKFSKVKDPD